MPKGNSSEWTYAEQLASSFHSPKIFLPEDLALKFSAHVQIYLLPRAQVCCCCFMKHSDVYNCKRLVREACRRCV